MSTTDIERIYDLLDAIRKELSEMNERLGKRHAEAESRLALLETLRADCRGEVVSMHKALRGNGQPGWFRRVEALEAAAGLQSRWFWVGVLTGQGVLVSAISTVIARLF
mgnify:CR=1 FL=1